MPPRIYTYKITFNEISHYYYGVHKEKFYDELYWGSPVTHKKYWEMYTPNKTILKLFEYSDSGFEEALIHESELIKVHLNEEYCLNEHCGGKISLNIRRANGINTTKKHKELGIGLYGLSSKQRSEHSKKLVNMKVGIHGVSSEEKSNISKISANKHLKNKTGMYKNLSSNGKKGAEVNRKNKTGLWAFDSEYRSKVTKITNNQKWKCTITGHISNAGGLSNYQKARDINTTNRVRLD